MNVNELLQFVDRLVLDKTGKHLDDVQKAVIEGTYQRETYDEIAQKCHITKNHASDVGSELWKLLSDILNEEIKKSNFRSSLERIYIKSSDQSSNIYNIHSDNNHFCHTQTLSSSNRSHKENDSNNQSTYHNLTSAPQIINFYNRESELKTLTNWILNQNIRLISVLGLLGIGKTTLVKRFIDLNLDQFEVIIWKSFQYPKPLDLLLKEILTTCQQEPKERTDDKLNQLLTLLIDKKCLLILDDLQNLFVKGQFAGQYHSEYRDYQNLFKMITNAQHQSHLILISQEKCSEMQSLDEELYPIKCLELSGITEVELLENKNLIEEDNLLNLIHLYQGNPFLLNDITLLIKNIFAGNVTEFLAENNLVITKTMQFYFREIFERLSSPEQTLILELSRNEQPLSREKLRNNLQLSSSDLINGLQSLQERYLITKLSDELIRFKLSSIFREYLRQYQSQ
jgi:hypothetical protein